MSDEVPSWWPLTWEEPDSDGDQRATIYEGEEHKYSVWFWGRKDIPSYTVFIKDDSLANAIKCDSLLEVLCVLVDLEKKAHAS